jgi:hypothetical protein
MIREPVATVPRDRHPRLKLPGGARLGFWLVANVEVYDFIPPWNPAKNASPRLPAPDVFTYGMRDYGNRVGFWRLAAMCDSLGLKCTTSLSVDVIDARPEVFAACLGRGWDFVGHGTVNTRWLWGLDEAAERAFIAAAAEKFKRAAGRPLEGWFSPGLSATQATFDLLGELGFGHCLDLTLDDVPFPIETRTGSLIGVPYTMDFSDTVVYRQGFEAEDFARMIGDAFTTLYREGADEARLLCVGLHPYNLAPHRIGPIQAALEAILRQPGVWATTAGEIAAWYRRQTGSRP